jgi:hypothetical protein
MCRKTPADNLPPKSDGFGIFPGQTQKTSRTKVGRKSDVARSRRHIPRSELGTSRTDSAALRASRGKTGVLVPRHQLGRPP